MLICAPFHENNNVLSRLGINSNFIHNIGDLAGYYSKGQKCHLAHYCFNPSRLFLSLANKTKSKLLVCTRVGLTSFPIGCSCNSCNHVIQRQVQCN